MLDIIVKGISLLIVGFVMINLAIEIYTKVTHENFIEGLTGDLTYREIEYSDNTKPKLTLRTQASGGDEQIVGEEGAKAYCNTRDSCLGYVVYEDKENNANAVRQYDEITEVDITSEKYEILYWGKNPNNENVESWYTLPNDGLPDTAWKDDDDGNSKFILKYKDNNNNKVLRNNFKGKIEQRILKWDKPIYIKKESALPYVSILSKKHVNDPRDLEIVKTNFEDKIYLKTGLNGELCDLKARNNNGTKAINDFFNYVTDTAKAYVSDAFKDKCGYKDNVRRSSAQEDQDQARIDAYYNGNLKPFDDVCEKWEEIDGGRTGNETKEAPLDDQGDTYKFIRCKKKRANIKDECENDLWEHCIKEREDYGEDTSTSQTDTSDGSTGEEAGSGRSTGATASEAESSGMPVDQQASGYTLANSISNKPVSEKKMYEIINDLLTSHRMPVSSFILNGSKGLLKPGPGEPKPYNSVYNVF